MPSIKGSTRLLGLIGWPVEHSLSFQMHNVVFRKLGLDFVYLPLPTHPDNLKAAIEGLQALGFVGANVTIPHKVKVIQYLDEISTEAQTIKAVNTIKIEGQKIIGYNTDVFGFLQSLQLDGRINIKDKLVGIIGSGGAGRALATGAAMAGAKKVIVTDIIPEKAEALVADLKNSYPDLESRAVTRNSPEFLEQLTQTHVIANATPVGMKPDDPCPLPPEAIPSGALAFDVIYNIPQTPFLREAKKKKCQTINGLGMLVYQGARSFEIWTGQCPDIELMRKTVETILFGQPPP